MANFSRRQLARYACKQLLAENKQVIPELASYLHETKRTKEAELLIKDIQVALESKGTVVAEVSSKHKLDDSIKKEIETMLKKHHDTSNVIIDECIDPDLLGGVKICTASEEFDNSLRKKLERLKTMKV